MRRWFSDDSEVSGALDMTLAVGLLMLPIVILVASLPRWVETRSMAELPPGGCSHPGPCRRLDIRGGGGGGRGPPDRGQPRRRRVNHCRAFLWHPRLGQEVTASVTVPMPILDLPLIGHSRSKTSPPTTPSESTIIGRLRHEAAA